jgi:hypothetical protein
VIADQRGQLGQDLVTPACRDAPRITQHQAALALVAVPSGMTISRAGGWVISFERSGNTLVRDPVLDRAGRGEQRNP